ncbi:MAG: hypothetical protein DCC54_05530 [Anaerolineae bacterium]|nr:MAG: hypothetical protein DCC54_05530 [Anaerolineae bacterium]
MGRASAEILAQTRGPLRSRKLPRVAEPTRAEIFLRWDSAAPRRPILGSPARGGRSRKNPRGRTALLRTHAIPDRLPSRLESRPAHGHPRGRAPTLVADSRLRRVRHQIHLGSQPLQPGLRADARLRLQKRRALSRSLLDSRRRLGADEGQETSLRLLAWTFGLFAFRDAESTTAARTARLAQLIAAQADRVHRNLDFAASTRGNHAMSESFGIWLAGTLFPELKRAETYRALGRAVLEREAATHIFPDGAYSMYSLNYHRFILHVYFLAMRLGELNGDRFSDALYQSISRSLDFLAQLIEPVSGEMPVFGSNDGALVCPLDSCDFADYRPTLQMGWYLLHGKRLFDAGAWDESLFWLAGESALKSGRDAAPRRADANFPDGGVYILRGESSAAFIRCADYRERPSHADQLHVDLWMRGQNVAVDAGTFLYNGGGLWQNGLARTSVHNTVTVDGADQMLRFSRFTWGEWSRGRVLKQTEREWQGEHDGYARFGVQHIRSVISLEADCWLVVDRLRGDRPHRFSLQWLLNDFPYSVMPEVTEIRLKSETDIIVRMGLLAGDAQFSLVRGDENSTRGWRSRYYGQKEPALSLMLETERADAVFWTFFGFGGDKVSASGQNLGLLIAGRPIEIPITV